MECGRDKFKKQKPIICIVVKIVQIFPKTIRTKIFDFFISIKGNKGLFIRYILLKSIVERCGDNVAVHSNVYLFDIDKMGLGANISIHQCVTWLGWGDWK